MECDAREVDGSLRVAGVGADSAKGFFQCCHDVVVVVSVSPWIPHQVRVKSSVTAQALLSLVNQQDGNYNPDFYLI
ncbi:hypothetical protein E2C01_086458 [Portunus trituberculatus]|uniref:Uncharacterized protein n=1 Tax=Portunus trituberculatus TaxID=210409 RepID=A0A5B7J5G0_PORTR|nr:hypothetical protein [Portunus trituberculatus]